MIDRANISELVTFFENAPPAAIAGGIIVACLVLAMNAIRQSGRVRRVSRPELLRSGELARWDRLSNSRRLHR